jgi:nitrite reductase (NADH) small subunit
MIMQIVMKEESVQSEPIEPMVGLCRIEELPVGLGRAFSVEGHSVAVFRTRKGKLLAVDNKCPHKGGPLAEGMLAGDQIVCPLHAFRFDGQTGECDQPGECPVQAHEITEQNGLVSIRILKK